MKNVVHAVKVLAIGFMIISHSCLQWETDLWNNISWKENLKLTLNI